MKSVTAALFIRQKAFNAFVQIPHPKDLVAHCLFNLGRVGVAMGRELVLKADLILGLLCKVPQLEYTQARKEIRKNI